MKLLKTCGFIAAFGMVSSAHAVLIDFTGGEITQLDGTTITTTGTGSYGGVDYYVESGVKFDFLGASGNNFSYNVGDYYGASNDVIHGHWDAGSFGDMTSILVNKLDNSSFDLNYFKITTNTNSAGGAASGTEEVYLNALMDGINISFSLQLPSDDWGFAGPNSEIYLGTEFDGIKAFSITYGSDAVGFGMDEFFINQPAPPRVPEPASIALLGLGLVGMVFSRRRRKTA